MARILKLADRHGSQAVAGALSHAARYGAYSAEAIVRLLQGRTLRLPKSSGDEPLYVPEPVRKWLEGEDVEQKDLSEYDDLVERDEYDDKPDEDEE